MYGGMYGKKKRKMMGGGMGGRRIICMVVVAEVMPKIQRDMPKCMPN